MSFKFDNSVGYESVWCGIADKELMIQWNSRLKTGYGLLNSSAFNLSTLDVSVKCEVVGREPTNYIIKTWNFFSPLTVGSWHNCTIVDWNSKYMYGTDSQGSMSL